MTKARTARISLIPLLAFLFFVPVTAQATTSNAGDFGNIAGSNASFGTSGPNGGIAVGADYANIYNAPTNGLITEGLVGFGTSNPTTNLEVYNADHTFENKIVMWNNDSFGSQALAAEGLILGDPGNQSGGFEYFPDSDGTWTAGVTGKVTKFGNYLGGSFQIDSEGPGSNTITFQIGGATKMLLDNSGNLGVDVLSTTNRLDVNGAAAIGNGYAGVHTAPTNGLIVQGLVGIGTTTAADALDVGGGIGIAITTSVPPDYGMYGATTTLDFATNGVKALEINNTGAITTGVWNGTAITVPYGGTGAAILTSNGVLYGNGTGIIQVTAQGGANTILTANSGAPVWSATPTINTSLTTPLVIGGTGASSTLTLQSTTGSGASDAIIFDTGSQMEHMRITSTGSVGIGTAAPATKLDVAGAISMNENASQVYGYYTSSTDQGGGLRFNSYDSGGGTNTFARNGYAGLWVFGNGVWELNTSNASGTAGGVIAFIHALTVLANGNVGIGTTSVASGSLVTVNGNLAFTPTTNGILGTATNDNASSGVVGEYITANASGVSLTSGTATNITSISLAAGDWDVDGNVYFVPSAVMTNIYAGSNSTSATFPGVNNFSQLHLSFASALASSLVIPTQRYSLSSTTTIYLIGQSSFGGTCTAGGLIRARRVR
ncbi:MAG: hypothetical protein P4M15_01100 [Alphaproteobacteria bacterium]|nr:hypothetical protein [Alphaproteobacteria bacterium]